MLDQLDHSPALPTSLPAVATLRTLAVIVVLLLAFALRLYHLDFQSLEGDEGISLQRSSQPLAQMLQLMPVEHVPGYFVLLYGWLRVSGEQDFALRFLSVWPSVLAVALLYRWAASMGRPVTGLVAALLLATNSFQIWYAQQARMYSWLLMTSLLSFWSLWRMVTSATKAGSGRAQRTAGRSVDLLYIFSTAATVYLHYFGFLVPLAQTLFMGIWTLTGGAWSLARRWLLNGVVVFLLFLPWLGNAFAFLGFQGWREALDPWQVPWTMHSAYSVGFAMPQPWQAWLPWLYLLLALAGLWVWWRHNHVAWLLLLTATFVPFALILVAVLRNPDFHERYSLFLAAPWLLLIAAGFSGLLPSGQADKAQNAFSVIALFLSVLLVMALAGANALAVQRLYFDSSLHKADYRSAAARIQAGEHAGDIVLVDGPNPDLVFNHYYQDTLQGRAPVHDLRPLAGEDHEEVDERLQEFTSGAGRVWELLYFRAPGPVQAWLATHAWPSAPSDHNGIRITLYGLDRGPLVEQAVAIPFGTDLELQQVAVEGPVVHAGDLLRVTTRWQVAAPLPDYKFSLRLLTPEGQVLSADDYMPQNWFAPTSQWAVGAAVDQRALWLPADLPAGPYLVTLRLYDPVTGVPVETPVGQDVLLGTVEVH